MANRKLIIHLSLFTFTLTESPLADEALIQPAELGRNFAEAVGNEDFFRDHLLDAICGTAGPSNRAP